LVEFHPNPPYNIKKTAGVIVMKEKSYAESMKKNTMNRKQLKDTFVLNLYIEMLLSEVQLKSEKEKLAQKIDQALDDRNQALFTQLSKKYKELNERFGN
jgi:uncharacterized protein YpiB (UPF0302 family)